MRKSDFLLQLLGGHLPSDHAKLIIIEFTDGVDGDSDDDFDDGIVDDTDIACLLFDQLQQFFATEMSAPPEVALEAARIFMQKYWLDRTILH